jgi:hypothetical protein
MPCKVHKIFFLLRKQGLLILAFSLTLILSLLWFLPPRGLIAHYYGNPEWKGEPVFSQREDRIDLNTVRQRRKTFPQTGFSIVWTGWIRIDREGEYTFSTKSDDGSFIFIDNTLVVNNGGVHPPKVASGKVSLSQGIHRIDIKYFQDRGDYKLSVHWTDPQGRETEIPSDILYPYPLFRGAGFLFRHLGILYTLSWGFLLLVMTDKKVLGEKGPLVLTLIPVLILPILWFLPPRGLTASYYDNPEWRGQPVFSRREKSINLEKVDLIEGTFPSKNFSIMWDGWIEIDREGEYTFSTISDDGSFLYLDNTLVVDNGGYHVAKKASGKIFLTRGFHPINIRYFQGGGEYELFVLWAEKGGVETPLPPGLLYPQPPPKVVEFLIRNLRGFYALAWVCFLGVVLSREVVRERGRKAEVLKRYLQNISLSLAAILVFLIVAEGTIRLILYFRETRKDLQLRLKESKEAEFKNSQTYNLKGIVQASPYEGIIYELKPRLSGYFMQVPLVTNSRGLRDFEYSEQKEENTFRIVGLGDSSLFGWGVKLEDNSLKVLERYLNQNSSSIRYEVINFSVPGYNTAMEVEVFIQKCLKYSPDLVLMNFNTNDYDIPNFMKLPQDYSRLRKSYLFDFIYSRYRILRGNPENELLPFVYEGRILSREEADHLDEDPALPEEYRSMVGTKGYIRAMNKLGEVARAHKIPVVQFAVISYPGLPDDPLYRPNSFKELQLNLITRLSQENGFFFLNTYPYYVGYAKKHLDELPGIFWVSNQDHHPNAVAHKIDAEALYHFLIENKLVPLRTGEK